jgi:hypothetical protein
LGRVAQQLKGGACRLVLLFLSFLFSAALYLHTASQSSLAFSFSVFYSSYFFCPRASRHSTLTEHLARRQCQTGTDYSFFSYCPCCSQRLLLDFRRHIAIQGVYFRSFEVHLHLRHHSTAVGDRESSDPRSSNAQTSTGVQELWVQSDALRHGRALDIEAEPGHLCQALFLKKFDGLVLYQLVQPKSQLRKDEIQREIERERGGEG